MGAGVAALISYLKRMEGLKIGRYEASVRARELEKLYKLEEISLWRMTRQAYQIVDDMFGRLVVTNEPFLALYLSGAFTAQDSPPPLLPNIASA